MFFLAKDVLNYKDLDERPHRDMMDGMQQFPGGTDYLDEHGNLVKYEPKCPLWELRGHRFRLNLWPRGHLKTTLMTISHAVQWIINYPDVRILVSTAIGDQASAILSGIKSHFQFNEKFFWLFPEYCPPRNRVMDFGNQESFIVPNRQRREFREPTVSTSSLGKVISSFHYEVLMFSDLVDKENVKTPQQIKDVIDHFKYCQPLLERSSVAPHHGWVYVEGTRYAIADLYGDIIRKQEKKSDEEKNWYVRVESADPRDRKDGQPLWPKWFPVQELKRIEKEDEGQYNSQYRQRPIPESSALATEKELIFFPRQAMSELVLRKHVTIDLHGMENNVGNDYTVLTLCGFDRDGRVYVLEIRRGRFSPFETIHHIFDMHIRHNPIDFKMEKDAHARVLLPFLQRESSKRGLFPNIVPLKRDNKLSKGHRIRGLQAWFKAGTIRFLDDLPSKLDLKEEILNFPDPSIHDDILDTLADQMQNRDGTVEYDIYPDAPKAELPMTHPIFIDRFLGFEDGKQRWLVDLDPQPQVIDKTGIM